MVIPTLKLPVDEEVMRRRASGDWAFSGRIYLHPVFREHYLPNPVEVDTWRTIFVSDESPEMNRKDDWQDLPQPE